MPSISVVNAQFKRLEPERESQVTLSLISGQGSMLTASERT